MIILKFIVKLFVKIVQWIIKFLITWEGFSIILVLMIIISLFIFISKL